MIGYIKGTVEEMFEDSIFLERDGVGFRIFVSSIFLNEIGYGDELKIYTYMNVREDSITLFGFKSRDELDVYKKLINVSGVGPKAAMNILSVMSADDLRFAVVSSDSAKISKAPGIGKKTAQKILIELKDKFDLGEAIETKLSTGEENNGTAVADTVEALVALGYSAGDALRAARKAEAENGAEDSSELLKQALKYLF